MFFRGYPSVVRLGELDLSKTDEDSKPEDYGIKTIYLVEDYAPPAKYHDIAILELDRVVKRSDYIDIACVDTSRFHNQSDYLIMGWGKTEFVGRFP